MNHGTRLLGTLAIAALAGMPLSANACRCPHPDPAQIGEIKPARPRVEVAFVLDTTGSMSGLIEGAKAKIWSIANTIATEDPAPEIRMALVAYRDRGDAYITKQTALTSDLDAVYADLMGYTAQGGGDGPESVNQALSEAINDLDWSDDDSVLKIVYLVGDAPPHMDYEQDVPYTDTCVLAAERGIIINTVQCGTWDQTGEIWREIALGAEGEFFAIDQSGGMVAIATPFDEELGELSRELDETVISYGTAEEQIEAELRMNRSSELADAAAPGAAADRAAYKSTAAGEAMLGKELVQDLAEGRVDLNELDDELLPEVMQSMNEKERTAYVKQQAQRRAEVTGRIQRLNEQRQAFLKDKLSEQGADGFDQRVLESYRRQAASKGLIEVTEDEGADAPKPDDTPESDEKKESAEPKDK